MDFWTAIRLLRRRWLVVVVGLALTAGLAAAAFVYVKPKYLVSADYLLIVPDQTILIENREVQINPYLNFSGGLSVTAEALVQNLNGQAVAERVVRSGGSGTFEAQGFAGAAPIITLLVEADTSDAALRTIDSYSDQLKAELAGRQASAGAPKKQFIVASPLRVPIEAEVANSSRVRALAAVLAIGFVLSIFAAFLIESRAVERERRRAEPAEEGAVDSQLDAGAAEVPDDVTERSHDSENSPA